MTRVILLVPCLLLLACAVLSGCTTDTDTTAPATTIPATEAVTVTVTTATPPPVPTVERIRALPAERRVNLVLTKDRPTSEIHLQYQGGPGDIYVTRVMMRVYTSDTVYQEFIMSNGRKPVPGDEIVVMGTRNPDRCEVFVISSGTRYKIMDEYAVGGMYY